MAGSRLLISQRALKYLYTCDMLPGLVSKIVILTFKAVLKKHKKLILDLGTIFYQIS